MSFLCEVCGETFENKQNFIHHHRIFHDLPSYSCRICGMEFTRNYNRKRHEGKIHGERSTSKWCSCVNTSNMTLNQRFPCSRCSKILSRKDSLKRHIRLVHENQKNIHQSITLPSRTMQINVKSVHRDVMIGSITNPSSICEPQNTVTLQPYLYSVSSCCHG